MQENKDKITPETAAGKFLFFYPKTVEESLHLIDALTAAGFKPRAASQTPATAENILKKGLGVLDGHFFTDPNRDYNKAPFGNWTCQTAQIDQSYLPPDQRFMLDLFNKLSERLERIEHRLDDIEAQLNPAPLEKKGLPPTMKPGRQN